ncbi:26S proteasome complex subunit sem-1 [Penicillium maclennaniae]|uniref:26S proteasome complex subunit sem-1 n=1 Tax=Penicillium maclennaniae TaxID=1343394 RepID=UPI0025418C1D|nr:26S proteasome complex subunit sem-1 [Penicillium maclennaniae]KAJ5684605.1 26S proteasome complex subunit sem-1 [Penicillium maclennaniae]
MSNSTTQTKAEPTDQPQQQQKPQVLEEDDEFEDFPVEGTFTPPLRKHTPTLTPPQNLEYESKLTMTTDWPQEEAEQAAGSAANGGNEHLWEESWDDDDAAEDFSKQLKYAVPMLRLLASSPRQQPPHLKQRLTR